MSNTEFNYLFNLTENEHKTNTNTNNTYVPFINKKYQYHLLDISKVIFRNNTFEGLYRGDYKLNVLFDKNNLAVKKYGVHEYKIYTKTRKFKSNHTDKYSYEEALAMMKENGGTPKVFSLPNISSFSESLIRRVNNDIYEFKDPVHNHKYLKLFDALEKLYKDDNIDVFCDYKLQQYIFFYGKIYSFVNTQGEELCDDSKVVLFKLRSKAALAEFESFFKKLYQDYKTKFNTIVQDLFANEVNRKKSLLLSFSFKTNSDLNKPGIPLVHNVDISLITESEYFKFENPTQAHVLKDDDLIMTRGSDEIPLNLDLLKMPFNLNVATFDETWFTCQYEEVVELLNSLR